jgi:hypothetical protein
MTALTKNRTEPFINGKASPPAPEPPKPDRNGTGQFQPGCKPGPGEPVPQAACGPAEGPPG